MSEDEHSTHEERMEAARAEMEAPPVIDPTSTTPQYQAEVGRSTTHGATYARVDGVVSSPKISRHDVMWERLRNEFNEWERGMGMFSAPSRLRPLEHYLI